VTDDAYWRTCSWAEGFKIASPSRKKVTKKEKNEKKEYNNNKKKIHDKKGIKKARKNEGEKK
jgi:hypothetical protein